MSREWTASQLEAINAPAPLIVPAAAGSGKTAVLVERVMRLVCDDKQPCNIDELLILTFTRAAAEEMRRRIAAAITERLAREPANLHLKRQAILIHRAQITTVHGFCSRLLGNFGYTAGLDSFRIGDENEIAMLEREALDLLIEDLCAEGRPEFLELVEQTSASRNDRGLEQAVVSGYALLRSHPHPEGWLMEKLEDYSLSEAEIEAGALVKVLIENLGSNLSHHRDMIALSLDEMGGTEFEAAYSPAFEGDLSMAEAMLESTRGGWDEISKAINSAFFGKLKGVRGEVDEALKERITGRRQAFRDYIKGLQEGIFSASLSELKGDLEALKGPVGLLFEMIGEYSKMLAELKAERGVIWFDDLEHLTLKLLCGKIDMKGGEFAFSRSPLAARLSEGFREIMVDEYQDINLLQDTIIALVSKERENIFMVGDIKQSIYRFRMANPDIFTAKYDAAREGRLGAVPLSHNFRSRREILDFANLVFSRLMQRGMGETDYDDEAALRSGPNAPEYAPAYRPDLCIVDMKSAQEEDDQSDDGESPERAACEAAFAAEKIASMISSGFMVRGEDGLRPSRPEDYAILLRSYQNKARYYEAALAKFGIGAELSVEPDYFAAPEIICAMALLSVIENPRQDIWLISALRAPCFGFTAAELAEARVKSGGDMYDALCAPESGEKAERFLGFLQKFRALSADLPVCELLMRIYDETHLVGLFSGRPGGSARRDNLLFLLEAARRYDAGAGRGLFGFINYLEASKENGRLASAPLAGKGGGEGVRIMSVHNAKGLEFSVVFVCDTARLFNQDDLRKNLLIHRDLGVGLKRREVGRGIEYTTLPRDAIAAKIKGESMSEEMRILYVALTRARDKLVVTMSFKDANKALERVLRDTTDGIIPPAVLAGDRNAGLWMLRAVAGGADFARLAETGRFDGGGFTVSVSPGAEGRSGHSPEAEPARADVFDPDTVELFKKRLAIEYPAEIAAIPSKLTATALKGGLLEGEAAEDTDRPALPMRPIRAEGGISPLERGRAMHLSMQLCALEKCDGIEGTRAELKRLYEKRILTKAQFELDEPEKICAFVNSEIGRRALAGDYRREFKFSLLVGASEFFETPGAEGERVLLQGVVDLFFEEDGELVIVDFKSDRIRPGFEEEKAEQYRRQLEIYALALGRMSGKRVKERQVWFFETGWGISV